MGASLSPSSIGAPSSSLSSSLPLLTPFGTSVSSSIPFVAAGGVFEAKAAGGVAAAAEDGGALNMDCCSSVVATLFSVALGMRYVPSNFAMMFDFPLAY